MAERLFNSGHHRVIAELTHAAQRFEFELAAEDRGGYEHLMGGLGETRQAPPNHVANVLGNPASAIALGWATQRPSRRCKPPDSTRWRNTSSIKNGLPSVSRRTARTN